VFPCHNFDLDVAAFGLVGDADFPGCLRDATSDFGDVEVTVGVPGGEPPPDGGKSGVDPLPQSHAAECERSRRN
jgi:hypothetical protein